jgi:hypothetical protein
VQEPGKKTSPRDEGGLVKTDAHFDLFDSQIDKCFIPQERGGVKKRG